MGPGEGLIGEGPRWGRLWYSAGAVAEGVTQSARTQLLYFYDVGATHRRRPRGRQRSEDETEGEVCGGKNRLRGKTTFSGLKKIVARRSGAQHASCRVLMGLGAGRGAPRSVRGGHSARYASRRLQRGSERAWAPGWSDATAAAMLETLEAAAHEATGCKQLKKAKVMGVLASTEGTPTRLLISCSCEDLVPVRRKLPLPQKVEDLFLWGVCPIYFAI